MKAFPSIEQIGIQDVAGYKGMDLRDYFAAVALQGIIASSVGESLPGYDNAASAAYQYADFMMEERK